MKPLIFALRVVFVIAFGGLSACSNERPSVTQKAHLAHGLQETTWQPSPGHTQVPIWPRGGAVPDAQPPAGPEDMVLKGADVPAYKPGVEVVDNVSQPTMTVYAPKGKNTGVAVVVFPGGGYQILAIDLEGTEICDWLTSRGITAVLLKYRVPIKRVGPYWESPQALQDAQRTLGLVRFHAAEWHIDPHKIGVIGFSAGGHMVAATSTHYRERLPIRRRCRRQGNLPPRFRHRPLSRPSLGRRSRRRQRRSPIEPQRSRRRQHAPHFHSAGDK